MHLLPRDEMRPDVERTLHAPTTSGESRDVADPASFRSRIKHGRLGALRDDGLILTLGAEVAYRWSHATWAFYVSGVGLAMFAAAHVGALVAVLRASRYAPTVSR
jgi:hypothetical protein